MPFSKLPNFFKFGQIICPNNINLSTGLVGLKRIHFSMNLKILETISYGAIKCKHIVKTSPTLIIKAYRKIIVNIIEQWLLRLHCVHSVHVMNFKETVQKIDRENPIEMQRIILWFDLVQCIFVTKCFLIF